MTDFNDELNRVLRYSMDTVENLVSQLAAPENNHHRWGGPDADHTFRGVVADALRESDRHTEADLLSDPKQHVVVDGGRVRAGRFNVMPVLDAVNDLSHYLFTQHFPDDTINWQALTDHPKTGVIGIDTSGGDDFVRRHVSGAGRILADAMEDHMRRLTTNPEMPLHREYLNAIRTAPYEEVDHTHPSEQQ